MPTRLGQNFLKNNEIVKKIIRSANINPDDFVLEIGPGKGALSLEIQKLVKKFIMIEKDNFLAEKLARNFQFPISNFQIISNDQNYKLKNGNGIISGDIIKIDLRKLLEQNTFKNYKVIANLPYYITSPIIRLFLEAENPPAEMTLMVQKEVAERIVAKPGKMSILAASVQYYAHPEILFYVGKENFDPVPKVDSAVIRITPNAKRRAWNVEQKKEVNKFFKLVRAGFSAKRKKLANNLSSSLKIDKKEIEDYLEKIGIKKSSRAQELSVEDWEKLSKLL